MAYEVVYDTNLKLVERSSQFSGETFVLLGILLLFIFIAFLFFLSTRKRLSKLEDEFSLVKSSIKKITFEVAKLSSKVSNFRVPVDIDLQRPFSKPPELTEADLERIVSLMISKAPVKINKEKLKEMIAKNDLKALARALKMSTSEVEILLNLRRKGV
ncbi:hypothetical protein [Desulfurobacterium crinifex]